VNLLEATVAAAIVATVTGATLGAAASATKAAGGNPVRDALQAAATREMRVALDVLKYQGASIVPRAVPTGVPLATGTPLPAQLSIAASPDSNGALDVTVTAAAEDGSGQVARVTETLDARAPLPGSQTRTPALVPAPTGAP
jgi:hypothetical protein